MEGGREGNMTPGCCCASLDNIDRKKEINTYREYKTNYSPHTLVHEEPQWGPATFHSV